jgi:hypothetical protein
MIGVGTGSSCGAAVAAAVAAAATVWELLAAVQGAFCGAEQGAAMLLSAMLPVGHLVVAVPWWACICQEQYTLLNAVHGPAAGAVSESCSRLGWPSSTSLQLSRIGRAERPALVPAAAAAPSIWQHLLEAQACRSSSSSGQCWLVGSAAGAVVCRAAARSSCTRRLACYGMQL